MIAELWPGFGRGLCPFARAIENSCTFVKAQEWGNDYNRTSRTISAGASLHRQQL